MRRVHDRTFSAESSDGAHQCGIDLGQLNLAQSSLPRGLRPCCLPAVRECVPDPDASQAESLKLPLWSGFLRS